ncbi:MAG: hypothetical protein ACXITV_01865 [Luteibaculaceae bacterium]
MIKFSLIVVNFLLALLLGLFLLSEVSVTHNFPEYLKAGETKVVEFTINKSDIQGFAKLELTVPEDITVSAQELSNATYTFKDNIVKLIWINLPTEDEFTISLKFTAGKKATGSKIIDGDFLYVNQNERKKYQLNNIYFSIGEAPPFDIIPEEVVEEPDNLNSLENEISSSLTDSLPSVEPIFEPVEVQVKRTVKQLGQGIIVELEIEKGALAEFGRLIDTIPNGFTLKNLTKNQTASFSGSNNLAKYTWTKLPDTKILLLSYEITPTNSISGTFTINGEFSYFENETAKKVNIKPNTFTVEPTPLPKEEKVTQADNSLVNSGINNKETEKNNAAKEKTTRINNTTDLTSRKERSEIAEDAPTFASGINPKQGLIFRVQVEAGVNLVTQQYFTRVYEYKGRVTLETHEGWLKYSIGYFSNFREANIAKKTIELAYNFPGPFVTAYYNGDRISLQEAFMLNAK